MGVSPITQHEYHAAECSICISNDRQIDHLTKKLEREKKYQGRPPVTENVSPKFIKFFAYSVLVAALVASLTLIGLVCVLLFRLAF